MPHDEFYSKDFSLSIKLQLVVPTDNKGIQSLVKGGGGGGGTNQNLQ